MLSDELTSRLVNQSHFAFRTDFLVNSIYFGVSLKNFFDVIMLPFSRPVYPVLFLVVLLAGAIAFPLVPRTGRSRQPRIPVVRFGFVRYYHSPVTNQWTILHTQEGRYAPFELQPWSMQHVENERWYLNVHGQGFTTEKQGDQWARTLRTFEVTDGITLFETPSMLINRQCSLSKT
ncbi:hypothetical protein LENED_002892 [Lentinula edodes]|uniref:Uncharacterized protein n=1 Tax=Lentinula edodes TaxID=5353 RepID=A0A1Q3E233_LENED|nr:hypothetical protein LENED_002892 [Lentinula edodes]